MLTAGGQFGPYRIEAVLGAGGSGVVYRAFDTRLERVIALKVINEQLAKSKDYRDQLAAEARSAARIDSDFVVKVWEYDELDNQPYISLEYIPGLDLRESTRAMDFFQKVEVSRQIAEGIRAAHARGLIHRDLKPENIKLTEDGRVKIFDFGLAKSVSTDSVDAKGNIAGTLHYASPEQLSGEPLTLSSDLFSFGVVIFELFTGERPFEGDFSAGILYSILHEEPPAPREIDPTLPEWFDHLVLKLLAKQPGERYDSIASVIDYLKQCLEGQEVRILEKVDRARQSVTVIDLKNLSGDSSWDYFCQGFTEDVIKELTSRTDLVISAEPSTSSPRNIRDIFKRCRSDYVIDGSLMRWQDQIKLDLSVYGDYGDRLVGGETYRGSAQNLFDLLADAARKTSQILAKETGSESIEVEEAPTTDVTAYDFYLRGRNYYYSNTPEDHEFAAQMFSRALDEDSSFALAHAGLADVYTTQYMSYLKRTPDCIARAKEEALKALEIDPELPDGHRSLGRYYMFTGSFGEAEQSLKTSISFSPKFAVGYRTLAWLKELEGDHDESMKFARKALELAPTDLDTLMLISIINMDLKKYTLAMATLQRAIELSPDYGRAHYNLGQVYMKLGVLDLAMENFQAAIKFKGDPNCYIDAGYVHMVQRRFDHARECFKKSIEEGFLPFVSHYYLGYLERSQGNTGEAEEHFAAVLKAGDEYEQKEPGNLHVIAYRALTLACQGQKDQASVLATKAEACAEDNGEVLYVVARVRAELGEVAAAKATLDAAFAAHAGPTEREVAIDPHFQGIRD